MHSLELLGIIILGIICICWVAGTLVGFLPLLGWHKPETSGLKCFFTKVMDYNYLVFLYFFTIIFPALVLAAFYAHIYSVILKQLGRMERQSPGGGGGGGGGGPIGVRGGLGGGAGGSGTMLRVLGAARKREVKATQNLSIIVLFFVLCWFPLYTINCVQAFCPTCWVPQTVLDCCIILSHLNSAGNPLLYAYHLKDFRAALRALLLGPGPGPGHDGGGLPGAGMGAGAVSGLSATSRTPALRPPPYPYPLPLRRSGPGPGLGGAQPTLAPLATITTAINSANHKRKIADSDGLWSLGDPGRLSEVAMNMLPGRPASASDVELSDEEEHDQLAGVGMGVGVRHLSPRKRRSVSVSVRSRSCSCPESLPLPLPSDPLTLGLRDPEDRALSPVNAPPCACTSPRTRMSPLRVVGEFLFSSSCSWRSQDREDANGKASTTSTDPLEPLDGLDLDTDLDTA